MKKNYLILLAVGLILMCCTLSCAKQNTNLSPVTPPACDTVTMKYTANVLPILQANCYSCHANGSARGGVNFDDYAALKVWVDNGKFVGAVTHASGYIPMPYNLAKLDDCTINKILSWVKNGAKNN